jgi:flagellar M-ring protein FliF
MWSGAVARIGRLNPQQRLRAALSAAVVILAFAGLLWYAAKPDTRVLYAALNSDDARQIAAALTAAGLPFEVSPDGATIRVPSDSLDKARLVTTAKGGPKSGRMGFELFDKPNWVGSEFDEKVNYQRALEGELEHTIASMGSIESARVHLTMPHDSLFSDQQREAKGSVVLKLKHRSLSAEEADSVRNLVASAVDDLSPDNVILADADGHAVLGRKSASAEAEAHEQSLAERLIETLEPVAGVGNVRASVNVDYDTSVSDETDESYDPASVITLSMQKSQQTSTPPPAAAGVPGTASNAPNAQPPLFPSQASSVQNATQENGTYGASKRRVAAAGRPGDEAADGARPGGNRIRPVPRRPDQRREYLVPGKQWAASSRSCGADARKRQPVGGRVEVRDYPRGHDGADFLCDPADRRRGETGGRERRAGGRGTGAGEQVGKRHRGGAERGRDRSGRAKEARPVAA